MSTDINGTPLDENETPNTPALSRMIDAQGNPVYLDASKINVIQQIPGEGEPVSRVIVGGVAVDVAGTPDIIWGYSDTLGGNPTE